jgi:hypothetical protein
VNCIGSINERKCENEWFKVIISWAPAVLTAKGNYVTLPVDASLFSG